MADVSIATTAPVTMADVLGKTLPALSATSDMPIITQAEAPEIEARPETKPEATAAPDPAETDAVEPGDDPAALKADNTDPAIKREITKARNRQREADARATAAEQAATEARDQLKAALSALEALKPTPAPVVDEPKPARDKFDDPDAYETALTAWAVKQGEKTAAAAAERARTEAEGTRAQEAHQADFRKTVDTFQTRREKAMEEFADYVDVAESADITITPAAAMAIMQADNGPAVAYHLGKNPAEAARLATLTPPQQVFEIGRLSATLAMPKAAAVSRAPDPITPLGSRGNAIDKTPDEMSMDEYAAHRARKQGNGAAPRPH